MYTILRFSIHVFDFICHDTQREGIQQQAKISPVFGTLLVHSATPIDIIYYQSTPQLGVLRCSE